MSTAWETTQSVKNFIRQFSARFPLRDKASDGTIGDLAHQLESASSHNPDRTGRAEWRDGDSKNEVRAYDGDSDLRDVYGKTCEQLVQYLIELGRAAYKAGKYFPIRYIIYRGRIWSTSSGWVTKRYTGASPHNEHFHLTFTFSQKADEDNSYDYRLAAWGVPAKTEGELVNVADQDALIKRLLDTKVPDFADPNTPDRELTLRQWIGYGEGRGQINDLKAQVKSLSDQVATLKSTLDQVVRLLQTGPGAS
jgi:hypothetical protein